MKTINIGKDFDLPLEAVTQTFAILAKRGVGKTYTGAVMVEGMLDALQQVVVVDPIGVWWGLRSSSDGKAAGFPIVVFGGEHADVPLEEHSGEIIAGAIIENGISAILDLSLLRKGAQVRFMTAFAETLYRLNRKPLHLAVDEADAFCPQRPMSDEARLLGAFEDIVRRGRARGIGITLITQRAAVINKNVLTQCEVLVCLRTIAPQDREAIEAWIEVHGTQKQRDEMMAHIPSLPVGTAYFWSPGWLDIFRKVEVRKRTTFDSSSTPKIGETQITPKQAAKVDLEKLGEQIKNTVERAKANDPTELKRRVKELETKLAKADVKPIAPKPVVETEVIETAYIRDNERAGIKHLIDLYREANGTLEKCAVQFEKLQSMLSRFSELGGKNKNHWMIPKSSTPERIAFPKPDMAKNLPSANNGESKIGAAHRKFLTVLAQRQGKSTRRNQLAVFSGYSSKSSHVDNTISALRTGELIEGTRDCLEITQQGLDVLGHYTPLPTGQDLVNYWIQEAGSAGGKMLACLVELYPKTISRDELADATGFSIESSHVDNTISYLRTLELITGKRDSLKAAEELFE